jgi:hypothetical protein
MVTKDPVVERRGGADASTLPVAGLVPTVAMAPQIRVLGYPSALPQPRVAGGWRAGLEEAACQEEEGPSGGGHREEERVNVARKDPLKKDGVLQSSIARPIA